MDGYTYLFRRFKCVFNQRSVVRIRHSIVSGTSTRISTVYKWYFFSIQVENRAKRKIRATKGELVFSDLFGAEIFQVGVTINDKIRPGGSIIWKGEMPYNEFIQEHVHFSGFKTEDLGVQLKDEQIVFE